MSRIRTLPQAPMPVRKERVDDDEICPVCKSSRYLNPNMKFLINECYHKMCESCVERIFTHGPAPCPIPGCGKVLRKIKFHKQTFEDIAIEREVDIRKRIAKIFNKRQSDFVALREYNDYLEEVEDISFKLIHNIDVEETEKKVSAYEMLNKQSITANASLAASETAAFNLAIEAERASHLAAREAARREEEEERRSSKEARKEMLRKLANAKSEEETQQIVEETELKIALKRSSARRREEEAKLKAAQGMAGIKASLLAASYKPSNEEEENTGPFSPFSGLNQASRYYVPERASAYDVPWLHNFSKETQFLAGGYALEEYYEKCLFEAFSGLTVFTAPGAESEGVEDEDAKMADQSAADLF